tara:strand:+ start:764 stop:1150 length:387 start_codon:yes stop_codon:yes gene_type:complete
MAYISQEKKKELAPKIKEVLKKHGVKGTISVSHHSNLVVRLKSGKIDLYGEKTSPNWCGSHGSDSVNTYWINDHHTGKSRIFLKELHAAMNDGNWDKSDAMTDYFNVGWYSDIVVGNNSADKPYVYTA